MTTGNGKVARNMAVEVAETVLFVMVLCAVAFFAVWGLWTMTCLAGIAFGVGDSRILFEMLCRGSSVLLPFPLLMLYIGCVAFTYNAARRWLKKLNTNRKEKKKT